MTHKKRGAKMLAVLAALVFFAAAPEAVYGGDVVNALVENQQIRFDASRRPQAHANVAWPPHVTLIQEFYAWLKIEAWMGSRWVSTYIEPDVTALDAHLQRFGTDIAVFYMDIASGFAYMHNPDRVFFSASVNKIQHALHVYNMAEQGLVDLARIHTYTAADYWGGTGIMRHMAFGGQFTTQELLTLSIRYSDNVAFRMLVREYGLYDYMNFVRYIGADETLVRNITSSNITARDAGLWALAIFQYISSDGRYAEIFKADAMNTNAQLIRADYPIANKYGWATDSFHDMAIIYADSPFILVILSNMDEGAFGVFANISDLIQNFHRTYFG